MPDTITSTTYSITGVLVTSTRHRTSRDQRRAEVIKASKIAEVIDLTGEGFLAAVTNTVKYGINRPKLDGANEFTVPNSLEKSIKRRNRKYMILLGKSLFIKRNGGIQKYTWNWWAESWRNVENGTAIKGPVDICSVVEISVRPAIGYPVEFSLKPKRRRFIGLYGEVGDRKVSVGFSQVKAMVSKPWLKFVGSVSY